MRAERVLIRVTSDDADGRACEDCFDVTAVERGGDGITRELELSVGVLLDDRVSCATAGEFSSKERESGAEEGGTADSDDSAEEWVDDKEFDGCYGTADRCYLCLGKPREVLHRGGGGGG